MKWREKRGRKRERREGKRRVVVGKGEKERVGIKEESKQARREQGRRESERVGFFVDLEIIRREKKGLARTLSQSLLTPIRARSLMQDIKSDASGGVEGEGEGQRGGKEGRGEGAF